MVHMRYTSGRKTILMDDEWGPGWVRSRNDIGHSGSARLAKPFFICSHSACVPAGTCWPSLSHSRSEVRANLWAVFVRN